MIALDGARALAWRLARNGLGARRATDVVDVAERVVATRAWPSDAAEVAFAIRQDRPQPGGVRQSLDDGRLVCVYAFRGGSYVMTPKTARTLMAVRTATRVWETDRFQRQGGFAVEDWEVVRAAVRDSVADGPRTRGEIAARLAATPSLRHLEHAAETGAGSDTLYKPLHWAGDLAFGPERDGQATFRLLSTEQRPFPSEEDVDAAGRVALLAYLWAYGPATAENLQYWLTEGLSAPRRRVLGWLSDLAEEVSEVTVDGVTAYLPTGAIDEIGTADPSDEVALLPAYDPWVMGPGTADARVVPTARRALLTTGANAVVRAGVVAGTWKLRGQTVSVAWFDETGPVPRVALAAAVERFGAARGAEGLVLEA